VLDFILGLDLGGDSGKNRLIFFRIGKRHNPPMLDCILGLGNSGYGWKVYDVLV